LISNLKLRPRTINLIEESIDEKLQTQLKKVELRRRKWNGTTAIRTA
jgi:hypothetical protein